MAKKLSILGSTGSIGKQTLDVVAAHPEQFQVTALAAGSQIEVLSKQIEKFRPSLVSVATAELAKEVQARFGHALQVEYGESGLQQVASAADAELVVTAVVGTLGLRPTMAAVLAGKEIALANKETLVAAGHLITDLARRKGVRILPVDSEHSAIFQCIHGESCKQVARILLTASGGAFRDKTRDEMQQASLADALAHPNWSMGAKITIDSATLMNKGLEVIEAHWLFDLPYEQIEVLIHPQSIVHSLVEFQDRSVLAQLGTPDMRIPIQYALAYPERLEANWPRLDLLSVGTLTFNKPDLTRFPILGLAFQAGKAGGSVPAVLNAANEMAVSLFLDGKIGFLDIERTLVSVLEQHAPVSHPSLDEILALDQWARETAKREIAG
ncbi:1-deoxy-D-xylulose-5-phosphate reductoisomerase [Effusibacillus dendaii]|uniref:1-deoxy-D-xylulose 5-phosphate reductoisomerase n=1 Tax=Effusibacillus dendaii TaxID=2743772 RepID=A0A7I8D5A1_9BACL|nr:1-deoxy-D-xylulose-5-phosphate reductoisomerase [Effusibacillus dendaii]BCJ85298.1 1-deoxy-D-xylulose 5-phosphate reductoisomerase 1 [Effusibacillus dendaii]